MNWNLRREHGEIYVLSLSDGMDIPWKALPYGEYIHYTELYKEGRVPVVLLEDEIFKKSVVDKSAIFMMDHMKAGTIALLAEIVMQVSGSSEVDTFNAELESARVRVSSPLHQLVVIVAQAFPAYTLEQIYFMDYKTFMDRLAQAEQVLLRTKQIESPLGLIDVGKKKEKKASPAGLKSAWEQGNNKAREISERASNSKAQDRNKSVPELPSPPPISKEDLLAKRDKIDFTGDNQGLFSSGAISGHDAQDQAILQSQMIKKMATIYPALFKKE